MKSMASYNFVYIRDLPFEPRRELCCILDADRRWEELGGIYMSHDVITLTLLGQDDLRKKSPTWEILNRYDEQNGTLKQLFTMLIKMDHQRAMAVLKPYVDVKYFSQATTSSIGATLSLASHEFEMTPSCSSPSTSSQNHLSEAASFSLEEKETLSTSSKFNHNSVNLNKEFTKASMHSKMNIPNTPQSHSKVVTMEKSLNHSNFKTSYNGNEEESISDDCTSEGMEDNMNNLRLEALANENTQKQSFHFGACAASLNSQEDFLPDIMQISYEDICKATDSFNEERILGKGGFGIVYKGELKGTFVAIKRFIPRLYSDDPAEQLVCMKQTLNELNIFKMYCRYDHILPIYGVSLDGENPCLIYQFMVNGSLEDRLLLKNESPPLTWSQRSHIAECITKGLNYLHTAFEQPFVHGNIKSANIFLDVNMDAKIGDLELTRGFGYESNALYLPPEYFQHRHLSLELDIYSYGIVLLEIATSLRPFDPKRGKGKSLSEHVQLCAENGRLESLRDPKAGEENLICFQELLHMGQICSSVEISKRPPMSQMLQRFEKLKLKMSMFDRIHRLVNDKSCALPKNVSLLELQWYYNCLKPSRGGMSLPNRLAFPSGDSGRRSSVPEP